MISYFKREIENNTNLENSIANNLEKCQNTLQNGLKRITEEFN
jgi:hypothetical protein